MRYILDELISTRNFLVGLSLDSILPKGVKDAIELRLLRLNAVTSQGIEEMIELEGVIKQMEKEMKEDGIL
jgi:hypothetical protein